MNRRTRRHFLQGSLGLAGIGLLSGCGILPPQAQPTAKIHRIGYLLSNIEAANTSGYDDFRQGLREHGYVEGQNLIIELRSAEGVVDRLPDLAAELVRLPVDLIVAIAAPAVHAAKQATGTIPIVFAMVASPVEQGLVASLNRPGGNVTGVSTLTPEVSGRRVQLLKEAIPTLSRVAVLWPSDNPGQALALRETEAGARALGIDVHPLPVRVPDDIDSALESVARSGAEALIELPSLPLRDPNQVVSFASGARLPSMYRYASRVVAGGLMSYGPDSALAYRRAGYFVDRILRGAKPDDLPVEQPTQFEFVINLATAQALGLSIPRSVLAQATEVIR